MRAALGWLLACGLLLAGGVAHAQTHSAVTTLVHAEAAPSGWNAAAPPSSGWVPVKLMDYWNKRWPHHNGVVWYRLHWNQSSADAPVGLLLDYVCLADEVWVNGSLVRRDPHLVEPLSRSWVAPQYFLLDKPVLREGENTVLIRVSGLAAYQPGLGTVRVGDLAAIRELYQHGMWWHVNIHLFNFALSAVLGALFLIFWLLRRKETMFGWYALTTLFGAGYGWNWVASSTWPLASTDAWEAMISAFFVASITAFCIFLLRFCERRWPRVEAMLWLVTGGAFAMALLAPHAMGPWRNLWDLPMIALYYGAILIFLWHAARTPRTDLRVMALCLLVPVLISVVDLLVYLEAIPGNNADIGALTSPLSLIGMGFAVAWRFSNAMRRVEGFNLELRHEVDTATTQLASTLRNEHSLALANAHANERLGLVRDLHDGFGGSLVGAIALLEHQRSPEATRVTATLKDLRDDLRLVIDTTTHDADTDLGGLLAPLRRRWGQRFEAAGIEDSWRVEGLDGLRLGPVRSLNLLRFLQEALTNVLKHSGAAHVDIALVAADDAVCVEVRDDGNGFDPATHGSGAGLASLRVRARRLDASLDLQTSVGTGVRWQLRVPRVAVVEAITDA